MASVRIAQLLSLFTLATTAWCAAQQAQNQPLQFTIRQTSPNYILQAEMHNAGKDPLTVSFGMQYARMAVDAIHLSLTDAKGEVTTLTLKHYVTIDPNFKNEHMGLGRV